MPSVILKSAKTVWVDDPPFNVPGTQINIWKIKMEVDGERGDYSTMSKALANEGFVGDVELYTNKNGKEYVRQAPKEQAVSEGYQSNSKDITLGMVWKTVAGIRGLPENETDFIKFFEIVKSHADELILMSEQMKANTQLVKDANDAFAAD